VTARHGQRGQVHLKLKQYGHADCSRHERFESSLSLYEKQM